MPWIFLRTALCWAGVVAWAGDAARRSAPAEHPSGYVFDLSPGAPSRHLVSSIDPKKHMLRVEPIWMETGYAVRLVYVLPGKLLPAHIAPEDGLLIMLSGKGRLSWKSKAPAALSGKAIDGNLLRLVPRGAVAAAVRVADTGLWILAVQAPPWPEVMPSHVEWDRGRRATYAWLDERAAGNREPKNTRFQWQPLAASSGMSVRLLELWDRIWPRSHPGNDVLFVVSKGEARFSIGQRTFDASAPALVRVPRATSYAIANAGTSGNPAVIEEISIPPRRPGDTLFQ